MIGGRESRWVHSEIESKDIADSKSDFVYKNLEKEKTLKRSLFSQELQYTLLCREEGQS